LTGLIGEILVFEDLYMVGHFHYIMAIGSAFVLITGIALGLGGLVLNTLVMIVKEYHPHKK
jgi:hypothetical protein